MARQKDENANVLSDPIKLKEFKQYLVTVTHYLQIIDDQKETIKETIDDASKKFSIDKGIIRKLANVMFKRNYADIQEENTHFEILYEALVGQRIKVDDPLDQDDSEEVESE